MLIVHVLELGVPKHQKAIFIACVLHPSSISAAALQVAHTSSAAEAEADCQVTKEIWQALVWLSRRDCNLWLVVFSCLHTSPGQHQPVLLPVFAYGANTGKSSTVSEHQQVAQLVAVRSF